METKMPTVKLSNKMFEMLRTSNPHAVMVPARQMGTGNVSGTQVMRIDDKQPDGFGQSITWDRSQKETLLILYLNAADNKGISIEGMKAGDWIQVTSAAGLASFSESEKNKYTNSLIGVVAEGLKLGAELEGYPEAAPFIGKAEAFAQQYFKPELVKTKRRDAFGVDPSDGLKARAEGGVLICLPGSEGPYFSGGDNSGGHKRWIQGDGTRIKKNYPAHVQHGFFLIQDESNGDLSELNSARINKDGEVYLIAWDSKHDDNFGYYKLHVKIIRGDNQKANGVIK
ncbi:MAG TPA: hypothetical protein VI112_01130 [Bacteroidia bacterium]|jgi:hypothetical protein